MVVERVVYVIIFEKK